MARIAGVNIPQNKLVQIGLTYIYGIGDKYSKQICSSLEIPKEKFVAAGGGLQLIFGMGAISGPILCSLFMKS